MAKRRKLDWWQKPNVSVKWTIIIVGLWWAVLASAMHFKLVEDVENKLAFPLYFEVRDLLGLSPKLDDKIKVFGVDDSTVAWLGSPNLTMSQWVNLLREIDSRSPKAIIIDAMFSIANIPEGTREKSLADLKSLNKINTDIIVGAFVAPKKVSYRQPIDKEQVSFDLRSLLDSDQTNSFLSTEEVAASLPIYQARSAHIYGPDPLLRPYLGNIGHILYSGNHRLAPLLRLDDRYALPHFMVLLSDEVRFSRASLYLDSKLVPSYRDGTIALNFSGFSHYLRSTKALRSLLDERSREKTLSSISEGDYVYIIPPFYTGNTDFKLTPFGHMPGGYAHLAFLNSLVQDKWLRPLEFSFPMLVLPALLGVLIALKVHALGFAMSMILSVVFWVGMTCLSFAHASLILPLILPLASFFGGLVTVYIQKSRMSEKKAQFVRLALEGSIRSSSLDSIVKTPSSLDLEAKERVVSVMFIDIVGFSLLAENQLPRIAFDRLKEVLSRITEHVHHYGGVVNKNLGDGLLCFFGYSFEDDATSFDHAEKALECAIAIQKDNLPRILEESKRQEPVYPLRIGINTASVYMGNLGGEARIDFTVVGNGVNFAKRLESACEPNTVMISETTAELIQPIELYEAALSLRSIKIKHHKEVVKAWEYNPFFDQPDLLDAADKAHKSCKYHARLERRWNVDKPDRVKIYSSQGMGILVNFSTTGLSLRLANQVIPGAILSLSFDSEDGSLAEALKEKGLENLAVDVRWSYSEGKSYLHGLRFRELSSAQTGYLVEMLCDYTLSSQQKKLEQMRHDKEKKSS